MTAAELEGLVADGALDESDDTFAQLEEEYSDDLTPEELSALTGETGDEDWFLGDFSTEDVPNNPYLEFGERIIVYEDGLIMKPYPFPTGVGAKIDDLLRRYGNFKVHDPASGESQPLDAVAFDFKEDWIVESWSDPRSASLDAGNPIALGDMLFVTAAPELMRDVENFINLFAATVRQIEIEAKIVEVTTTDSFDVGLSPVDENTPMFQFGDGTFVRDINFSYPAAVDPAALFTMSSVHDSLTFNAVLEAVAGLENVSLISRPKVAVREGARAEIQNTKEIPFFDITSVTDSGGFNANLEYREVGVQMYVIPRVVGTQTVVLNIDIEASQETGTAVTVVNSEGDALTNPIISIRKAKTLVRLEPGQAVILGGLISERTVERERGVPLLMEIPWIGNVFKSTSRLKEQTNVLFFIRPRILEGSDVNRPFE